MDPVTIGAAGTLVQKVGLPLAAVVLLTAAVVALLRHVAGLMKEHAAERKADRDAHLAALGALGDGLGGRVELVKDKVADVQRIAERILDRLPTRGGGSAAAALLFAAALLGCAHSSQSRETARAELHAESHAALAAESHEVRRAERVVVRHRAPVRVVKRRHRTISYAATPTAPARVETTDDVITATRGGDDSTETTREQAERDANVRAEEEARRALVEQMAKENKARWELRLPGLWQLLFLGLAVAALAGAWDFVTHAGGFVPALKLAGAFLRRLFGRK